jgi:hypothetical protein
LNKTAPSPFGARTRLDEGRDLVGFESGFFGVDEGFTKDVGSNEAIIREGIQPQ